MVTYNYNAPTPSEQYKEPIKISKPILKPDAYYGEILPSGTNKAPVVRDLGAFKEGSQPSRTKTGEFLVSPTGKQMSTGGIVVTRPTPSLRGGGGSSNVNNNNNLSNSNAQNNNILLDVTKQVSDTSLKYLSPLTSKDSALRLTQQYNTKSLDYQRESTIYNTQVALFNKLYGEDNLSEEQYRKANLKSVSLELSNQKLEKEANDLTKLQSKIKSKEIYIKPIDPSIKEAKKFNLYNIKESILEQTDIIPLGVYGLLSQPYNIVNSFVNPIKKAPTIKESVEGLQRSIPMQLVSLGLARSLRGINKEVFKPNKVELISPSKKAIASVTKIENSVIEQGQLGISRIALASVNTPKVVRVTSRIDRAMQLIENARSNLLKIEPKQYGQIISTKPSVGGSISREIIFLNGKPITKSQFLSKYNGGAIKFNELTGGMYKEVNANMISKANKDLKELANALAESRTGVPNFKVFGKERPISLGYQESKEIAKITSNKIVTGDFGGIKVSQRRPIVKPTPSGNTIERSNVAGVIDELKNNVENDLKIFRETFVGKDVTFPYSRKQPFKVEGIIIEKNIKSNIDKGYSFIEPSGKKSNLANLESSYSKQIMKELQKVKVSSAQKITSSIKIPTNKAILKQTQVASNLEFKYPVSDYYGLGLYERTESVSTLSKQDNELKVNLIDRQLSRLDTNQQSRLVEKQISRQIDRQLSRLLERQIERQPTRNPTKLITPKINKPIVTNRFNLNINNDNKNTKEEYNKKKSQVEGYDVYGKSLKSSNMFKINDNPLTRSRANDVGAYYVTKTLAKTFIVKKSNRSAQPDYQFTYIPIGYFNSQEYKLRNYRIQKGQQVDFSTQRYIQKGIYGLSSQAEKRQIQEFRKMSKSILG